MTWPQGFDSTLRLSRVRDICSPRTSFKKILLKERSMIRESSIDFAMNCPMTLKMWVRLLGGFVEYLRQHSTGVLTGPCHFHCHQLTWVRGTVQADDEHVLLGGIGPRPSKALDHDVRTLSTPENRTQVSAPNQSQPLRSIPPQAQKKKNHKVQTL